MLTRLYLVRLWLATFGRLLLLAIFARTANRRRLAWLLLNDWLHMPANPTTNHIEDRRKRTEDDSPKP